MAIVPHATRCPTLNRRSTPYGGVVAPDPGNEILRRLDEHSIELREIKADVKETKAQAQKTNGRVTALEAWRARWEGYRDGARAATSWVQPLAIAVASGLVVALANVLFGGG